MWVITKDGFYSAVLYRPVGKELPDRLKDRPKDDIIVVRCRALEDAEAFVSYFQPIDEGLDPATDLGFADIVETPNADYQYRVFVTKDQWVTYVEEAAYGIDYDNFKSAIKDGKRHDIYMRVWSVLNSIGVRRQARWWDEPELPGMPERSSAKRVVGTPKKRAAKKKAVK